MDIPTNVEYLLGLSMAAERLVTILRGIPWLALPKQDPLPPTAGVAERKGAVIAEAKRSAKINLLAVATGIISAELAHAIGALPVATSQLGVVMFGVLAGAGSGFWNAILSYVLQVKDLKKAVAESAVPAVTDAMVARLASGRP